MLSFKMYSNDLCHHNYSVNKSFTFIYLSCSYVGRTLHRAYGYSYSRIWLDGVQCVGNEKSLAECPHKGWAVYDCSYDDVVSISCRGETVDFYRTRNYHKMPCNRYA